MGVADTSEEVTSSVALYAIYMEIREMRCRAEVAEDAGWASLTLLDTSRQDAGLYSCSAENEVGSAASEVRTSLDVFCKFYQGPKK